MVAFVVEKSFLSVVVGKCVDDCVFSVLDERRERKFNNNDTLIMYQQNLSNPGSAVQIRTRRFFVVENRRRLRVRVDDGG
jgi:hypothetical protein